MFEKKYLGKITKLGTALHGAVLSFLIFHRCEKCQKLVKKDLYEIIVVFKTNFRKVNFRNWQLHQLYTVP